MSTFNPIMVKPYEGDCAIQMPVLLKDGFVPAPIDYVWQQIVGSDVQEQVRETFQHDHVTSGNIRLRNRDGDLKVVTYQPGKNDDQYFALLRLFQPQAWRDTTDYYGRPAGAVVLKEGLYDTIDAPQILAKDLHHFINVSHSLQKVVTNEILLLLALGNKDLLRQVHALTNAKLPAYRKLKDYSSRMAVHLNELPKNFDSARLWIAGTIDRDSNVCGDGYLVSSSDRLIGLVPREFARGRNRPPIETIIAKAIG